MANGNLDGVMQNLRTILAAQDVRDLPDQELLERFLHNNDQSAFAALVQRHGGMVLGVCRNRLHRVHDAEDACQVVFLILAKKAASIRQRTTLASWLHGVACRVARDHAQRLARREAPMAGADGVSGDVADEVTWRELQAAVDEEFGRLPEQFRAPLVLCYLEGKTRDEAASQLGWSLATLRGRLERGRTMLRSRLVRRGLLGATAMLATLESCSAAVGTLPVHLCVTTTKAALCFAADPVAAAQLISPAVAQLTKGVLKSMFIAKLKVAVAAGLALVITGVGAGTGIYHAVAGGPQEVVLAQAPDTPAPAAPKAPPPVAVKAVKAQPAIRPGVAVAIAPFGQVGGFNSTALAEMSMEAGTIVIGKVVKFEDKEQLGHRIAVIKIQETVKGNQGFTSIRIGIPTQPQQNNGGGPNIAPPGAAAPNFRIAMPMMQPITEGMEGLFFLTKHEKVDCEVLLTRNRLQQGFINKTTPTYEAQAKTARELAKFLETPVVKSLDSEKASDRLLAAGLLILKYRTVKNYSAGVKQEPIDAEESKKILKALADSDLNAVEPRLGISGLQLFFRLGVTVQDGWQMPRVGQGGVLPPNGGKAPPVPLPPQKLLPGAPAPVPGAAQPANPAPPGVQPAQVQFQANVRAVMLARPVAFNNPAVAAAVKEWLKKNADTYRIKRYVEGKKENNTQK